MVSFACFVTIFLAYVVTVSRSEEVITGEKIEMESKWLGMGGLGRFSYYSGLNLGLYPWLSPWMSGLNGGCYGFGFMGSLYNNLLFVKANDDDTKSVSRRAISLDAEQLFSRSSESKVSCVNDKGASDLFVTSHCIQAVNKLVENRSSSASCGSCKMSLFSPKDRVAPQHVSASMLEKTAHGILKACSNRKNAKQTRHNAREVESNDKQVAMVLSKGNGAAC